jgi:hypothetical protein
MSAAEARKMIGKPVTWLDTWCPKNGFIVREGVILEVKGKNVRVDQMGMTDWKWLPDMRQLKLKEQTE